VHCSQQTLFAYWIAQHVPMFEVAGSNPCQYVVLRCAFLHATVVLDVAHVQRGHGAAL
jgi:hypothetical protein